MVLYTDLLGVLGSASTLIGRRKFFGEVDGELTDSQTHGKHDKIGKLTDTPTRPVLYWFSKGLHSATATQNTDEHCFYALEVTQQEATLQSLPLFRSLNSQMLGEHCQNR